MINVLRGDMSLVGPRPLPCDYTLLLGATEARRLWVQPGLFGLAQAEGRNALPWGRRLACDVHYADQKPEFVTDVRIALACCVLLQPSTSSPVRHGAMHWSSTSFWT
jgi:lipopolysaccharide/colanic/teichoic acid biosynthesis glycosyltransferase